jgi:hypothetical protein
MFEIGSIGRKNLILVPKSSELILIPEDRPTFLTGYPTLFYGYALG